MTSVLWIETASEHYRFRFRRGSLAEREIATIRATQERCFEHICSVLAVTITSPIQYVLCDSADDVAQQSGCDEPATGITRYPDTIYAEYSDRNRAIGMHEDAHIVAYNCLGLPTDTYLREALAMYFDGCWWGLPNRAWVQHMIDHDSFVTPSILMDSFDDHDCSVSYPIAGFWAEMIVRPPLLSASRNCRPSTRR